jgi:hypothetical protein
MKLILLIESGNEGMKPTRTLLKVIAMDSLNTTHQSTYPESRCNTAVRQITFQLKPGVYFCV